MKVRILYLYHFLIELFKENLGKSITLILTCLAFFYAGSFEGYIERTKIERSVKVDTGWVYLYSRISDNKIKYELIQSNAPLELKNGFFETMEYHEMNVLLWVIFVIGIIILAIGTFSDEFGWSWSDTKEYTIGKLVECEYEDGKYIYLLNDRLLGERDRQISSYKRVCREFDIYSLSELAIKPNYETKNKKRQNALQKLGII